MKKKETMIYKFVDPPALFCDEKDQQNMDISTKVEQEPITFPSIRPRVFPKRPSWLACLFSKKKREERKKWYAYKFVEIVPVPMVYEPREVMYLDFDYRESGSFHINPKEDQIQKGGMS